MNLDIGSVIGGRYRLTRHIAAGGMGRVWEAHDDVLDRYVAVKVLHPQFSGDTEFVGRFRAEAKMTARVQHANVAQVYDYGDITEDASQPLSYLIMEFVRGEALSEVLRRTARLSEEHTLDVLEQTARALQAAHDLGLVHRDIKPGNIMITPAGQVKLTDFGIAKAMGEAAVTQTGMIIGTAHYISPEQAMGEDATPAGDVYSLAVVGYECLAGQRPFNADSPLAIAMAHVRDEPPALPEDVSPQLRQLIAYGMAKDPAQRYPDGASFAASAAAVRAGHDPIPPIGAIGDQATEHFSNTGLLGPAAAGGAAGALGGAAAAGRPGTQRMPGVPPSNAATGPRTGQSGAVRQDQPVRRQQATEPAHHEPKPRKSGAGCIFGAILAILLVAGAAAAAIWFVQNRDSSTPTPPPVTSTVQSTVSTVVPPPEPEPTTQQPEPTTQEPTTSEPEPSTTQETPEPTEPDTPTGPSGPTGPGGSGPVETDSPAYELGQDLGNLFNGGEGGAP